MKSFAVSFAVHFILYQAYLVNAGTMLSTQGSFFHQIEGSAAEEVKGGSTFLTQEFFACGEKDSCSYLVKNTESNKYQSINKSEVLKRRDNDSIIWQKDTQGRFASCADARDKGFKTSKVYQINLPNTGNIDVSCDMERDGGGWIVFQRRVDNTVDFFRNWTDYRRGFGDLNGNFWLGLDKLNQLAAPGKKAILRVDIKHMGFSSMNFAKYTRFEIADESDDYRLTIGGYTGDAGDSLAVHNGMKFTTKDRENDQNHMLNCAKYFFGAWWYNNCHSSNLNGLYPPDEEASPAYMSWSSLNGNYGRVTFSEMKMKYEA